MASAIAQTYLESAAKGLSQLRAAVVTAIGGNTKLQWFALEKNPKNTLSLMLLLAVSPFVKLLG